MTARAVKSRADGMFIRSLPLPAIGRHPPDLARIILAMVAAQKGGNVAVLGADGLAAMLTSVDDLGCGLGVALQGEVRDRIAMKPGNNLGFRSGLCRLPRNGTGRPGWSNGQMPIAEGARRHAE